MPPTKRTLARRVFECPLRECRRRPSSRLFNAHNPGDGGSGLVQPVFRSPARIPAAQATRRGLCTAPPSEKRYTLSHINIAEGPSEFRDPRRGSAAAALPANGKSSLTLPNEV